MIISSHETEDKIKEKAIEVESVQKYINNESEIKKIIYIKEKLINIVIG